MEKGRYCLQTDTKKEWVNVRTDADINYLNERSAYLTKKYGKCQVFWRNPETKALEKVKLQIRSHSGDSRGGARPGAGRKAFSDEGRRVNFSIKVAPSTKEKITALRSQGITLGILFDDWVSKMYDKMAVTE